MKIYSYIRHSLFVSFIRFLFESYSATTELLKKDLSGH